MRLALVLVLLLAASPSFAQKAASPAGLPRAKIAILDKRTGEVTDVEVRPGEAFAAGRLSGVMRDCQRRAPPARRETGAFLELSVTPRSGPAGKPPVPARVFSGWMFVESPSLNPLRHAAYDVWVRSCTIAEPEIALPAPARPRPPRLAAAPATSASSAPQSAEEASASSRSDR